MGTKNIPFQGSYLEHLPLNKIAKYPDGPPKNGVPFTGYPQQHRTDKKKLILVHDPLGEKPLILEFKLDDILYVEDVPQMVTEKGEGVPLAKLWIRKASRGIMLVPFEIDESLDVEELRKKNQGRFTRQQSDNSSGFTGRL